MKKIFIFSMLVFIGCSKTPVDMDEKLFDRGGRYITRPDFSSMWFYNLKVYNGPAFSMHKNGERKEKGDIVNGAKSGSWSGWEEKGNLQSKGDSLDNKEDGKWMGYHVNGKTKYEGLYKDGKQIGKWTYFNKRGKLTTEEEYNSDGIVVKSKNFK